MWNEDYKEMLECLIRENVRFILVGAYALAAHGFPRATLDIDIWVEPSQDNVENLLLALKKFGAPLFQIKKDDFLADDTIFQIGVAPRRVDIITGISGVLFQEAFKEAVTTEIDGIKLKILSLKHIIQNKKTLGRHKDIDDIEKINKEYNF